MTVLSVKIAASGDDGQNSGGTLTTNSNNNTTGSGYRMFLRFTGVTVPAGSTISSATLTMYRVNAKGSTVTINVAADDADNSAAPTTSADLNGRTLTASTGTSVAAGAANTAVTMACSTAVTAVLGRSGWASGNALMLILTSSATSVALCHYDNGNSAQYPELSIDYTSGGGGGVAPESGRFFLSS